MVHIQIPSQAVMQIQIICYGSGSGSGPAVIVRPRFEFESGSGFKMITTDLDPDWQRVTNTDPKAKHWQKRIQEI
jgi:hypothetical protein